MDHSVNILLKADRQRLTVETPRVVATGVVEFLHFVCELSDEWAGYDEYYVIIQGVSKTKHRLNVVGNTATCDADAVSIAGGAQVCLTACAGDNRITTQAAAFAVVRGI